MSGRIGRSLVRSLGAAILGTVVLELAQAIEPATSVAASAQPGTPPAVTPSVRFKVASPVSSASASVFSNGLILNRSIRLSPVVNISPVRPQRVTLVKRSFEIVILMRKPIAAT